MAEVAYLLTYRPQGPTPVRQSPHLPSISHRLLPQWPVVLIARPLRFLRADLGPSTTRNTPWHLPTKQGRRTDLAGGLLTWSELLWLQATPGA